MLLRKESGLIGVLPMVLRDRSAMQHAKAVASSPQIRWIGIAAADRRSPTDDA